MAMSNKDRLALLAQVEEGRGNWREALEELIDDAEAAVIAEEQAEDEDAYPEEPDQPYHEYVYEQTPEGHR